MKAESLARAVRHAIILHDRYPLKPGKRFRGATHGTPRRTPYGIHPVWAAITILHETALPEELRWQGALTLCYHDVPEDTVAPLPKGLSKRVRGFIEAMTFQSFDEEAELLWERPPEVRLFKLYDKVSNWLDGQWMYPERRAVHRVHMAKLAEDVERNFGPLNIVRIARFLSQEEG